MTQTKSNFFVSAVQMQCQVGPHALAANLEKAEHFIKEAAKKGSELVVLPEAFDYGYNLNKEELLSIIRTTQTREFLSVWAQKYNISISAGVLEKHDQQIMNKSVYVHPNGTQYSYSKIHLFKAHSVTEDQVFTAGEKRILANSQFGKLGFLICYDLRFPELARSLALDGAQTLLISSAWGYARREHFRVLQKARAIENQTFIVSADQVGACEKSGQKFAGHSVILDPLGNILAEADDSQETVLTAEIDLTQISSVKNNLNCLAHRVPQAYEGHL